MNFFVCHSIKRKVYIERATDRIYEGRADQSFSANKYRIKKYIELKREVFESTHTKTAVVISHGNEARRRMKESISNKNAALTVVYLLHKKKNRSISNPCTLTQCKRHL